MVGEYITKSGYRLVLGRLSRQTIDQFIAANPLPQPPVVEVEVWGGSKEMLPMPDDPDFLKECDRYYLEIFNKQIELISAAVTFDGMDKDELEALYAVGLPRGNAHSDALRYIVLSDAADAGEIVRLILYNSTVTVDGIEEAYDRFGVRWYDRAVQDYGLPNSPAEYSIIYEARRAAHYCHMPWSEFCELSGPQQSEVVAFYRLETRLQWLTNKQR